jgi:hypothetical protein
MLGEKMLEGCVTDKNFTARIFLTETEVVIHEQRLIFSTNLSS